MSMNTHDTAVPLPLTADWRLWPLVGLRSAGMPAHRVLGLADGGRRGDLSAVADFAADPWFQEAVTWQNRDMVETWLAAYAQRLATGDDTLHRRSYRAGVIARYAQRYTTKNDTIGFFGPIGWARVAPDRPHLVRVAGDGRLVRHRAYFETRALHELALRWSEDRDLRRHLPPWRDPSTRLVGTRLLRPRRPPVSLSPDELAVLRRCDGRTTPAGILAALTAEEPQLGFTHLSEVLSVLSVLARRSCIHWGLRLPVDDRAEQHLAEQVSAVPDAEVREEYLARLTRLTRLRQDVDAAAGDPPRLLTALRSINAAYTELTGTPADRPGRERGAGRGLLWTDALADWDATIGGRALADLAGPLELLLTVCRWLTWEVARGIEDVVRGRLAAGADGRAPFAVLVAELAPELTGGPNGVLGRVLDRLHTAVAELLPPLPASGTLQLDVDELREAWVARFAAPAPGWEGARMHSPDVMLASPEADPGPDTAHQWVLNEIHVAVNTLDNRFFVTHQPRPGEIERLVARSTHGTRYVPAVARNWPDVTSRTYPPLTVDVPGKFVYWALEADDVLPLGVPRIPAAGLEVVRGEDGRPLVTDGAALRAPFTEFVGELLSFLVGNAFALFPPLPHIPRVRFGRLVVQRETWHLPVAEALTDVPRTGGEAELARRLRARGIPRHLYVRLPDDPKPFFCDLHSTVLTRNLLRLLRRQRDHAALLRVQEMLPAFDQLWLKGAEGGRRTSEFRLVAVDDRTRGDT